MCIYMDDISVICVSVKGLLVHIFREQQYTPELSKWNKLKHIV